MSLSKEVLNNSGHIFVTCLQRVLSPTITVVHLLLMILIIIWGSVRVGVPQRSILGPLLFSIFVNDLPSVVDHAQFNMYADDTELHCCGEGLQCVQNDLQSYLY